MKRAASFEKTSPAPVAAVSSTKLVPRTHPVTAPDKKASAKDVLETKAEERGWSLFSRGGGAFYAPVVDEPKFLAAHDAFWDALGKDDVAGVRRVLQSVSVLQRERLLRTPSSAVAREEWSPKLPLCRAVAGGHVAMTQALLELQADPWTGDPWLSGDANDVKHPATTPAFWGVIYGKTEALRTIYKCTRSTLEARRALCLAVHPEVLTWLVKKDVTADQLAPAMRAAVERNDAAAVRLLAKVGKADVNATCSASDTQTTTCSLLAYAVAIDNVDAAAVLVEFGAQAASRKSDPAAEGQPPEENYPLTLAIRKGFVNLVTQILHARRKEIEVKSGLSGAPPPINDAAYLLAAFDAPRPVEMYMSLYRAGLQPKTLAQAESVLEQAKDKNLDFLYAFIVRQRTLLLLVGEKKSTDAARALARTALDDLADALSENPDYASPTPLTDHAQAMTLESVMPGRNFFNVFGRWGKKKTAEAGTALSNGAANVLTPNIAGGPLMLGM